MSAGSPTPQLGKINALKLHKAVRATPIYFTAKIYLLSHCGSRTPPDQLQLRFFFWVSVDSGVLKSPKEATEINSAN